MKKKAFGLRMAPVLILVAATIVLSVNIYFQMIRQEQETCWERLEIATNSTSLKIQTRIMDNLNFLTAAADTYDLTHNIDDLPTVGRYLDSVVEMTIFDRLDVILPDESVITQQGESAFRTGRDTYSQLVEKGTHITKRLTSSFTGEQVICFVTPIERSGETLGLLVGTVNCTTLNKLFEVYTYGKACQLYVIDRTDGNYLLDNWHQEIGNIYDLGPRKSIYTEEMLDFVPTIIGGERGRFAFYSRTNGERSFQYCAPMDGLPWEVCVVVQEDVIFANVQELEQELWKVGMVEGFVVLVYVLWNMLMNVAVIRSENKVRLLEYEKAKNDARATFLSNMSHDIKTPLNGIVGMLQIIRNHRTDADMVDECLDKIEVSAKYLSTLTNDMLDITEIENDKLVLPRESMDLQRLAEELYPMIERQAADAGVTCTMNCSGLTQPYVLGSSVHIKRILVNLIGNAIKYSKNAGKTVWVTISDDPLETEDGQRMYRFVIRDNGIGMSESFQKNMYKAFEQETMDARSEYQGYGLGLTIVSHLVQKMGGTIALDSVQNQGSTFTVSIPFPADLRQDPQEHCEEVSLRLTGMHLLLVEDNELNMEIAHTLLTDAGAVVAKAVNGRLALEKFAASPEGSYDGIIMDMMMPVMDGCEAAAAIRSLDRADAKTVPILAMTANTFAEDIARCMEAGMNAHVSKPVDFQHLIVTILHCCSRPEPPESN